MKLLLVLLDYGFLSVLSLFLLVSPFSRPYSKVTLFAAFFFWLASRLIKKDFAWRFPKSISLALLAVFAVCVLSTLFSQDFHQSQKIVFNRYLPYLLALIMGFDAVSRGPKKNLYWLSAAFLFSGAVVASGGIRDYLLLHPQRLYTAFGREIPFAMLPLFITYFFVFSCGIIFFSRNKLLRLFSALNLLLLSPCFLWQGSRAAWVAIASGSLYAAALKRTRILLIIAAVILTLFTAGLFTPGVKEKLGSIPRPSQWNYRTPLYESALKMFRNYPLTGAGVGMYEKLVKLPEYALPADYPNPDRSIYLHPHSVYFEILAETGLFGIIVFFYFFISYFYLILSSVRRFADQDVKSVVVGISGLVFATLIFGISGSIITVGVNETFVFWFLTGLSLGLAQSGKQKGEKQNG